MKSLQGYFLVASPHLSDPNFYKGVVLMIKHDEDGAMGLILNRPTENTVSDLLAIAGEKEIECGQPVFFGGPVQGPPLALHRLKSAAEAEVLPGIFFTADPEKLEKLAAQTAKPFRFFLGYAGWASGQLEDELSAGGWLTTKAKKSLVFSGSADLWEQITRTIGENILNKVMKVKHVPDDPSLN